MHRTAIIGWLIACGTLSIYFPSGLFAQVVSNPVEFYPLQIGNLWQYRTIWNDLSTQIVVGDTLVAGRHYFAIGTTVHPDQRVLHRVDSLFRVQQYTESATDTCGGTLGEKSVYRLGELPGTVWHLCDQLVGSLCPPPWLLRFDGVQMGFVFGEWREVMSFTHGSICPGLPDTSWGPTWYLVRGIGIYHEEDIENFYNISLTGAIIGGTQYGTIVSIEDPGQPSPAKFRLHPIYPNPFNSHTTISFEVREWSAVRIEIWSVVGQKLLTLVDDRVGPGTHRTTFDGSLYSSGVYFCIANLGGTVLREPMIHLK